MSITDAETRAKQIACPHPADAIHLYGFSYEWARCHVCGLVTDTHRVRTVTVTLAVPEGEAARVHATEDAAGEKDVSK